MVKWSANDWALDLGEISSFPPIGVMYVAAYLKEYSHHEVIIIDAIAEKINYEGLQKIFSEVKPNIVGITSFTYTFYDVLKTAQLAKKTNPTVHVCIGGPHTFLFPDETMRHPEVDSMIIGDGEIAFKELIDRIETGKKFEGINGVVVYRNGDKIVRVGETKYIGDLDSLPFPAIDLLDFKKYYSTFGRSSSMATICSSRGCPFKCTYCQVPDKKYRMRSTENIIDEMLFYYDKGIRDFYFFDDMFNITSRRVISISEKILESRMKNNITWLFRGRVDNISADMLRIARMAGCKQILFGVEDYTDGGLKKIKKMITIKQAFQSVELAKKYGIETSTNWILGFPHHKSKQDIYDLIDTAIRINSDYAQFSILQLFPGCEMYRECVKEGCLTPDRWSNFVKNPIANYQVELYTKNLSAKELSYLYREAHIRYYRRISYILRRLLRIRSFSELKAKARAALAILK